MFMMSGIDHKLLDCPVCCKPLHPPIFQCTNGHVVCSTCCDKLQKACQVCSISTGCIRCRAPESVVESMQVCCSYDGFGCKETVSYTQKHIHEESCPHPPCYCPIQECIFHGTMQGLSVVLRPEDPFCVLRGEDSRLFLLLNGRDIPSGNSLSLACMEPGSMASELEYELAMTGREGNKLCLKGSPISIRHWGGDYPAECFLYVPQEFCRPARYFYVFVEIRKTNPLK